MSENTRDTMQSQWENVIKRDNIFTNIIDDFAKHQEKNNKLKHTQKSVFFWMVCICFVTVVVGCMVALIIVAQKDQKSIEDLGVILGSVASLIGAIIVLPSKIAENLFPSEGEKDFAAFFINAHRDDLNVGRSSEPDNIPSDNNEETFESLSLFAEENEE